MSSAKSIVAVATPCQSRVPNAPEPRRVASRDSLEGTATLLGAIQHKTPELIYQPRRYRHENTACRVEALTVCRKTPEECEAFAAAWNRLYEAVAPGADRDHVIPRVELYDAAALEEEWGYAPEPDRSPYAGITFRVEDLGKVKALAEKAGFPYREGEGSCRFDFHRELGLSLSFLEG